MQVRPLTREDLMAAMAINAISFLHPLDEERRRADIDEGRLTAEGRWGCFTDSGELTATVHNAHFDIHYDGGVVRMGGVGGVSTLPEHRYGGGIRHVFEKMLSAERAAGEVFSMLYPFNHEFYRKFGYELCDATQQYKFDIAQASAFKFAGPVRPMKLDEEHPDDVKRVNALYNRFAARYNASFHRDDARMMRAGAAQPFKDMTFCYLLGDGERPAAYLRYRMFTEDGDRMLHVTDCAFDGPSGLRAMLGFLGRMSADFKRVLIYLPDDIPLSSMLKNPYDVEQKTVHSLMIRPTNTREALARMARPAGAAFTVKVEDGFMPENEGVFRVHDAGATPVDGPADLSVSARALGAMCIGYLSLNEAAFRDDVKILGNERALEAAFVNKPIYQPDHY